jgi:hypothetical protein
VARVRHYNASHGLRGIVEAADRRTGDRPARFTPTSGRIRSCPASSPSAAGRNRERTAPLSSPLNALTQARSLAKIGPMGSDLIATILDADHETFEVDIDYALPGETGDLVGHAKSARVWLDSAQLLWQERATVAARTLAGQGYSLRDIAVLLGLSHQRVDQLLDGHADDEQTRTVVVHRPGQANSGKNRAEPTYSRDMEALLVIRRLGPHDPEPTFPGSELETLLREQATNFLENLALRVASEPADSIQGPAGGTAV